MDTLNIRLSYRPIRIGWCIKTNNKVDLKKALRLTHTLWGGRYNPLIPIDDPALAKKIVDLFRVDALYPISDDQKVKDFIKEYPYLPWPIRRDKLFISDDNKKLPTILDLYHPARHLYEKFIKNKEKPEIRTCFYEWSDDDPLSEVFLATFGQFPEGDLDSQYFKLIENYLKTEKSPIEKNQPLPVDLFNKITINQITSHILKYYRPLSINNPGFYIGDSHNTKDILTYWNLRASTTELLFYDPKYSERLDLMKDKYLEIIRDRPKDPRDFNNYIAVWTLDENKDQLDLKPFGDGICQWTVSNTVWNGLNIKPPVVFWNDHSTLASISNSTPPILSFQLPSKPFFDDNKFHTQHAIISLKPIIDLSDEKFTFMAPNLPELNKYYGRNCHFRWNKARIERDGLGIIINLTENHLSLQAFKSQELIEKVFSVYGMKTKPSQAGLLGRRLIKQMGSIQGCRVLKIKGVRNLIEKYSPYQSFTRSAAGMIIGDVDPETGRPNFQKYEDLVITYDPSSKKLTPDKAFSYLVKKGVFRVGLKFSCTNCELKFWKHLDDVKTSTACEFCGSEVNVSTQLKDRDWAYRRSGIFGREDHQEGGIPVAVTLQQLHTTLDHNIIAYSTALEISPENADINKCETDLVVLTKGYDGKVKLIIGECKTRKKITAQDVENMIKVADAFPKDRLDVTILFSKLDQFTSTEIELIKKTRKEYRIHNDVIYTDRTIMFTDRELEPYFVYEWTAKELQVDQSAVSIDDLVKNTTRIFFERDRGLG